MKKLLKVLMPAALALVAFALMPAVNVKAMEPEVDGYIDEINATFAAPTVGDPIQVELPNFVSVLEGSHYRVTWNMLIKGLPSEDPTYDNYQIEDGAVYEDGTDYYMEVFFGPEQVYDEDADDYYSSYYLFDSNGAIPVEIDGVETFERGNYDSTNQVSVFFKFNAKPAEEETKPAEEEKKETTPSEEKKEEAASTETETKEETPAAPTELKILDGANQEVDGTGDVTIRANGEFANFDKLLMDEKEVDPSNYDKKEGSTIVTLKAAYVASLGAGAHTVSFVYKDGSTVKTALTLKAAGNSEAAPAAENTSTPAATPAPAAAATDSVAPKTGENIMWIYVILAMSALGMGVTAVSIKKNK